MNSEQQERTRAQNRAKSAKYRALHRDKVLASLRAYRLSHLEEERARNKAYRDAHRPAEPRKRRTPEERRLYCQQYHAEHRDEIRARKRAHRLVHGERLRAQYSEWARANPELRAMASAKRRAAILRAMPQWVDLAAVKALYREASRLTRETGIRHDVDHVYPLQGREVSGLHVHTNLQILTHKDNVKKNNRAPVVSVGGRS